MNLRQLAYGATSLSVSVLLMGAAPIPNPPGFQGHIEEFGKDSRPWWPAQVRAPVGAPNVIIFLLDDVGYGQIGAFGGLIETPNIDAVAANGLTYTNFHSTSLCSPTRASLLTGRNHHSTGVGSHSASPAGFPGYYGVVSPETGSLAKILKANGYVTYATGKWDQVPGEATSTAGPFDQWPSGQGFDHFHGFLAADTNNFLPAMWSDQTPVEPQLARPDYHLSTDMADQSITWITSQVSTSPEKPFFLYFATGANHAPHMAPKAYIEKYRGRFDMGWDKAREMILARQKKLGVVPANAQLPPRPDELPAWDSLTPEQKRMAAREMEVFAAQLDHADHEFGRVVETLRRTGQLDNTLILVTTDNGASGEGAPPGTYNEVRNLVGEHATWEMNLKRYDDWGGPTGHWHYSVAWAMAGNTPFKYYKQTTHSGGVKAPTVMSWPKGIAARGIRRQFEHVNDIAPTVLDVIGLKAPAELEGVKQKPMDGISFAYTFADPKAPDRKHVQYFELFGNRAIYADGWKAIALANPKTWVLGGPIDYSKVRWELYNVARDFNERNDLAQKEPRKLAEMLAVFDQEARRYNVYPIRPDTRARGKELEAAELKARNGRFVFYTPGARRIPYQQAAPTYGNSFEINAEVNVPAGGADGVIAAQGGNTGGFTLYIKDGRPVFAHNYFGEAVYSVRGDKPLPVGRSALKVSYELSDKGTATARLFVGGVTVAEMEVPRTQRVTSGLNDVFDIGEDSGSPTSDDYASPFRFTGGLDKVVVDILPRR
jgi:arylsulfatase A-like enzyme